MDMLIGTCIFCIVLFLYVHIQGHVHTSEDLEMYEVDHPSKTHLEELCDLRQPVVFAFDCDRMLETTRHAYMCANYPAFDVSVRNVSDTVNAEELYVPLPLHAAAKLFAATATGTGTGTGTATAPGTATANEQDNFKQKDDEHYISENNADFLSETGLVKYLKYNDEFLRPYMVSNCDYDVLLGGAHTATPLRYELAYRTYFLMTQGTAQIKLAPPHSGRYLHPIHDYENFEFRSPVDCWQPQRHFAADFDKVKCLEFTLLPGKTLFVPAYWWYSIRFVDADASVTRFQYRTYANNLAILPYLGMHLLQLQHVTKKTAPILAATTTHTRSADPDLTVGAAVAVAEPDAGGDAVAVPEPAGSSSLTATAATATAATTTAAADFYTPLLL